MTWIFLTLSASTIVAAMFIGAWRAHKDNSGLE